MEKVCVKKIMPLRFDARQSLKWEKLSGDRYLAHAVLGKADLPLTYYHWDNGWKKRIETIREDELFKDESLLSARATPILLGHPKTGKYSNNKDGLLVGHTFDSFIREDGQLIMPVVVDDLRGVKLIDSAKTRGFLAEISPGYSIQGLKQDSNLFLQIGRSYDHLALLAPGEGRGGQSVAIRTDGKDDFAGADKQYFFMGGSKLKIKLDEKEFEVEDAELAVAIGTVNNRLDSLISEKDAIAAAKSKLEGELAGVKTRLDVAESSQLAEDEIANDIQERLDTWVAVLPALRADTKDFKPDYKLTPTEIKTVYLRAKHPDIKLDGKDAAFVQGVWEGLKPTEQSKSDEAINRTDALLDTLNRSDAKKPDDEESEVMVKVRDRYKNAYKSKKAGVM